MNQLLHSVLDAHGGLDAWNRFTSVSARLVTGGGLWPLKGLLQDAAPRTMTASLHEEFASVTPFGQPGWRTSFRPGRIAIETTEGVTVRERDEPRASFADHAMNTPWDPLHRAYFNGYAMWTYLTTPFLLALPGFELEETEPWNEDGESWRGLRVRFPAAIASHSREQVFYFDEDHLLRRHDYEVEVAGGFPAVQYVGDFVEAQGIRLPSRRRAYLRGPDGKPVHDVLFVAIDLSEVAFR